MFRRPGEYLALTDSAAHASMNPHRYVHSIRYQVASHRDAIKKVCDAAVSTLKDLNQDLDVYPLKLVLMEALTNALLYGSLRVPPHIRANWGEDAFWQEVSRREQHPDFFSNPIVLKLECREDTLQITVRDPGNGFDWRQFAATASRDTSDRLRGRGLMLIESYAEDIHWNEAGNEIRISLKVKTESQ